MSLLVVVQSMLLHCNTLTQAFVDDDNACKAVMQLQPMSCIRLDAIPSFVGEDCFDIFSSLLKFIFNIR
jgi:hypothetical protein